MLVRLILPLVNQGHLSRGDSNYLRGNALDWRLHSVANLRKKRCQGSDQFQSNANFKTAPTTNKMNAIQATNTLVKR